MHKILTAFGCIAALAASAAPALADTLQEVTGRGITMTVGGMAIDVSFTPDGKLTAYNGQVTGTWRIDADKLCIVTNMDPTERCQAYPAGKKSGDSFDITSERGTATIRIN